MKSKKEIIDLDKILLPYKITFPVTIEGSVNSDSFCFRKGEEVTLTFPQYEALMHSDYAKYLESN